MDNPETLAILGTLDTGQRSEKTKGAIKNGPFRDIGNIGHTRQRTKTFQRHWQHWAHRTKTIQRHWQHWAHKTENEDKQSINTEQNTEN